MHGQSWLPNITFYDTNIFNTDNNNVDYNNQGLFKFLNGNLMMKNYQLYYLKM